MQLATSDNQRTNIDFELVRDLAPNAGVSTRTMKAALERAGIPIFEITPRNYAVKTSDFARYMESRRR